MKRGKKYVCILTSDEYGFMLLALSFFSHILKEVQLFFTRMPYKGEFHFINPLSFVHSTTKIQSGSTDSFHLFQKPHIGLLAGS